MLIAQALTVYDPQTDELVEPSGDRAPASSIMSRTTGRLGEMAAADAQPRWKFWKRR